MFSIFNTIVTAISLWQKYGATAEKAIAIVRDLDALDDGRFFANVNDVLLKNGVDIEKILASVAQAQAVSASPQTAPPDASPAVPPVMTPWNTPVGR